MKRLLVTVLAFVCVLTVSPRAQTGPPTKAQIDALNAQFKDRAITAKLDLPIIRSVYVTLDGRYDEVRYQERLAAQPPSIPSGDTAKLTKIEVDRDKIDVLINRGGISGRGRVVAVFGGRKNAGSRIEIEFGRRITAADLTPETIVRAVSRIIAIEGMDPSVVLARPDELLAPVAAAAPASAPPASTGPAMPAAAASTAPASAGAATVQVLSADVTPTRLRASEKLALTVHYEISGLSPSATVPVVEQRQLMFDGAPLFSQPLSENLQRGGGRHSSTFDFTVPAVAAPGVYTFTVTVRAGESVGTKEALFQIAP